MSATGPLRQVRVLDFTRLLPGPLCAHLLSRLGATVVKVDTPAGGGNDYVRELGPMINFGDGRKHSVLFEALNAGKQGLGLDLKHKESASVIHRLIPHFDVVIEGNRPGVMDRLGIGYDVLSKINPKLIYCSISGYGSTGPMAKNAGHDINYMATAGLLGLTGTVGMPSQVLGFQAADATGALHGAMGIMAAMIDRGISGKGQMVDISLTESAMVLAMPSLAMALAGAILPVGKGLLDGGIPNYNIYLSSDGKSIAVGALEPHFWAAICNHIDRKDLLSPKTTFSDVKELFLSKSSAEWAVIAKATDACIEIILQADEVIHHPQHIARQVFLQTQNDANISHTPAITDKEDTRPSKGSSPVVPRPPQMVVGPRMSGHPPVLLPPAATIGEDTMQILKDSGFSNDEIEALKNEKVVFCD